MRLIPAPQAHQLDIALWFPAVTRALAEFMQMMIDDGLELFPRDGNWCWRWRLFNTQSAHGFPELHTAIIDAMAFRLMKPSAAAPIRDW